MKKITLLLLLVAAVTFASQAQKPAEFKFTAELHDFGKIAQNKPVTVEFKYTNTGDAPLIIKDATAECGCTTPILNPVAGSVIKKGQSGTVRVTFNAAAEGIFTKNVTIFSNLPNAKILTIKGEVTKPVSK